jgi:hypothetical protein
VALECKAKTNNLIDITMTENIKIQLAETILNNAGILENRALIVLELEEELATIYSELDDATTPSNSDEPI